VALVPCIFELVYSFLEDSRVPLSEVTDLDGLEQALISLDVRHAENILNGQKDIELRTRKMNLADRTRIWIYAKKPIAAVVGFASLKGTVRMTPRELWNDLGDRTGVSVDEFFEYFAGRQYAYGLVLRSPFRLSEPIPLERLRSTLGGFSPPQFFKRLGGSTDALGSFLESFVQRGSL